MQQQTSYAAKMSPSAAPVQNLLAAIVESSKDAIISTTLDGVITSWNSSAERMFGYDADEVIGKNISLITPPELREDQRRIAVQVQTGQTIKHYKTLCKGKDGQYIDINVTVSPVCDSNGQIIGTSHIMQDITKQQIIEAQLQAYMKELKNSNQDLHSFAHIASHDLKEPLRGLSGLSSILREDYGHKLDTDGVGLLNRITSLCGRMDNLINNLLYFSELENEKSATQETDLNDIIKGIRQMMEFSLKEKNAQIIVPHPLPRVVCNSTRITEVFRNLITNAINHNDKTQPMVEIGFLENMETRQGPEKNVFYVRDNGMGIEPQYQHMIFAMFKKAPTPQTKDVPAAPGTGVGLAFTKKIIERHKGRIWLESEPGKGTTFYFTINQKDPVRG